MYLLDIDMWTVFIVLILGHFTTAVLIVAYTYRHNRSNTVNLFLLSKLLQAAGWIMVGLRGINPGMGLKIAGNLLLLIGAVFELTSLLLLKNRYAKNIKWLCNFLMVLCAAVFLLSLFFNTTVSLKIALFSIMLGLWTAVPTYVLFSEKNSSALQKVIASYYGAATVILFCRGYVAMTSGLDMELSSTSIFNTGLFLLLYLVMMIGSVGFSFLTRKSWIKRCCRPQPSTS
jgi:hypothetical protein